MSKTLIGNFKGPKGDRGDAGDTGIRGSRWNSGIAITGTSNAATVFGNSGIEDALKNDMYLNTETGNTYRCTVGGTADTAKWVYAGNIKGKQGDKGEKGDPGQEGGGSIATKEDAGSVKPADGLTVEEDGTLKVNIDGTTLTMDQVNNVIKLADTLKDAINGAFPAANVANNQITTVEGFALDARQANPNIDGSLAKQISDLNGSLKKLTVYSKTITRTTSTDASFNIELSSNTAIVIAAYTNDSDAGIEVSVASTKDGLYFARFYDKADGYIINQEITVHIYYLLR